eukprot:TRINITY_DN25402_c0_g1_i1.p1 TRINITY_DN25402_c0_g1~~TRINITY_DN25402_c0_g1_i1.p1  ORF type:complete len:535 (+),score=122.30 TRINITY_DN25402_c0_g1_i1:102-1607(+)
MAARGAAGHRTFPHRRGPGAVLRGRTPAAPSGAAPAAAAKAGAASPRPAPPVHAAAAVAAAVGGEKASPREGSPSGKGLLSGLYSMPTRRRLPAGQVPPGGGAERSPAASPKGRMQAALCLPRLGSPSWTIEAAAAAAALPPGTAMPAAARGRCQQLLPPSPDSPQPPDREAPSGPPRAVPPPAPAPRRRDAPRRPAESRRGRRHRGPSAMELLPPEIVQRILLWLPNPEPGEGAEGELCNDRKRAVATLRLVSPAMMSKLRSVPVALRWRRGSMSHLRSLMERWTFSSIHLAGRGVGNKGLEQLLDALRLAPRQDQGRTEGLHLEANKITLAGARLLGAFLCGPAGLGVSRLSLSGNAIGDDGVRVLAEALTFGKVGGRATAQLSHLSLYNTGVGDDGAGVLARLATDQPLLTSLDLDGNHVTCKGAMALASALESGDCSLRSLSLWRNAVGDDGAAALAQAVFINSTLTELDLRGNFSLSRRGKDALLTARPSRLSISV